MRKALYVLSTLSVLLLTTQISLGQLNQQKPGKLQNVGVDEHLGEFIPLDAHLVNSDGDTVRIGDLIEEDKPVILNPVYYECPMLCSLVLNGLLDGVKKLDWSPGKDFTIITFSINPREDYKLAHTNKVGYLEQLKNKDEAARGWYFLSGEKDQIQKLTDAVGFKYEYDEEAGQYAHSAAIIMLSPKGKITRYLYGVDFSKLDLKNGLYDAADGKIGTTVDQIVLYCYQYDPGSKSYVPVAFRIMQIGGLATALVLGIFLGFFWLKERRSKKDLTD